MPEETVPADDPRDLSFMPVENRRPAVLTPEQIATYNRDGFIKPFKIFDAAGVSHNRTYIDGLLRQLKELNDGRDTYSINGFHVHCEGIYDLVMNPIILDLVEDLLGSNFVCWGTHYFCKMPHDPKAVPWHQDASYWPFTPARTVTVWLAIDDASVENACMYFIPGTHRLGHLKWQRTNEAAVLHQEISDVDRYGAPVPIELKAGEISLHADMLAHGSRPNPSDMRRCGLTMRYCPTYVRSTNAAWQGQAIVCRGKDDSGYWQQHHHARPIGDDLRTPQQRKGILIGAN